MSAATGTKTCLYRFSDASAGGVELVVSATVEHGIRFLPGGVAEQDPDDWWRAICAGMRAVLGDRNSDGVLAAAFCCQMQGLDLVAKATGCFAMTPDSATATFLYDTRPTRLDGRGPGSWSPEMCRLFSVDPSHLPEVVPPPEVIGPLPPRAAEELGLRPGTPPSTAAVAICRSSVSDPARWSRATSTSTWALPTGSPLSPTAASSIQTR